SFPTLLLQGTGPTYFLHLSSQHSSTPTENAPRPHPPLLSNAASSQVHTSQYKAKRPWPPDMSKLPSKHQFRLERTYRRRAKLKYARPVWSKWTKLVQWGVIGCALFSF